MKRLYVTFQYLLPHHLLSHLVGRLAQSQWRILKRILIRTFIRIYDVDMSEAQAENADAYACFGDFFVRRLKDGARPIDTASGSLVSPADGTLSHLGSIEDGTALQAKGMGYSIEELLGTKSDAAPYRGGAYATVYLAPRDYHRVHAPLEGRLVALRHIPGRLFAVNPTTTARIPRLFARNERVVMLFETAVGPAVMVLVGALIVGSIYTRWSGVVTGDHDIGCVLERGEEVAQFRMGSTVIVCVPKAQFEPGLAPGRRVRFGERIATLVT